MILYVDSTVRADSRTRRLAERLLAHLSGGEVRTIRLRDAHLPPLDETALDRRARDAEAARLDSPLLAEAREFAAADQIVVAAPFWDLSFPALLKTYIERINVPGIVFRYTDDGRPAGLCRARRLFYVSTAGGPADRDVFGYGYLEALATGFWGIPETRRIAVCGLDIAGADTESILRAAETEIDGLCGRLAGGQTPMSMA